MAGRVVRAEELNAVLESLQPKLAAADQEELRGVGGDETVSERHCPPLPPVMIKIHAGVLSTLVLACLALTHHTHTAPDCAQCHAV